MAAFSLAANVFPDGTAVGAYPTSNWSAPGEPSGPPVGNPTETKERIGGKVEFTSLSAGGDYWAAAQVGGVWRYVRFEVIPLPGTAGAAAELDETGSVQSAKQGTHNTALGLNSAASLTSAADITGVGYRALQANTTGERNTAIGSEAMSANSTGKRNTALGFAALAANQTGEKNVAVGASTLAVNIGGSFNTAVGWTALNANTSERNTAIGMEAMSSNNSGKQNVAIGYAALAENLEGDGNTAVGVLALGLNSGGPGSETADKGKAAKNTALGFRAGQLNNGEGNVFIGWEAGAQETGNNTLYVANSSTKSPLILGDFTGKTLTVNGALAATGALTGTISAAKPTALAAVAKEEAKEPSKEKLAFVQGFANCAASTKTKVEFIVNGVVVQKFTVPAAATAVTSEPFSFVVPAGATWQWKLVEGTVESLTASSTLIG